MASSSKVAVTAPSTEFSMGTMPRSAAPLRTASRVAWMLTHGRACPAAAASKASSAASVKVPSGPRYAYRTAVRIPRAPQDSPWLARRTSIVDTVISR